MQLPIRMKIRKKWRRSIAALILLFCLAGSAKAGLYTSTALSIEWLVDSADEVFHVAIVAGSDGSQFALQAKSTLKGNLSVQEFQGLAGSDNPQWKTGSVYHTYNNTTPPSNRIMFWLRERKSMSPACRVAVGDEWLLFTRISKEGVGVTPYLFYAMNLSRPCACREGLLEHAFSFVQLEREGNQYQC